MKTLPAGRLELLIMRDRRLIAVVIAAIIAIAWAWLVLMAISLSDETRDVLSVLTRGHETAPFSGLLTELVPWRATTAIGMFLMWWIMMIGMMLPSAAPMVLLFAVIQRKRLSDQNPYGRSALFAMAYLLVWCGFSLLATAAQYWLNEAALLNPMMASSSRPLSVALFAAGGVYQLTPLKQACLAQCRSPLSFISLSWRDGNIGAVKMGLHHGVYCLGCCWFLMALLFVGGAMNLVWVAAITVLVLLEKVLPQGEVVARLAGLAMLAIALWLIVL